MEAYSAPAPAPSAETPVETPAEVPVEAVAAQPSAPEIPVPANNPAYGEVTVHAENAYVSPSAVQPYVNVAPAQAEAPAQEPVPETVQPEAPAESDLTVPAHAVNADSIEANTVKNLFLMCIDLSVVVFKIAFPDFGVP